MLKNEKLFAWLAFAAVSIFWGTTYLAIRIGVQSFPPFIMAGIRNTVAGILLCSFFFMRGYKLPPLSALKVFAINGILMLSIGNGLVSYSEKYVSSGLAALICALTPIWIVTINSFTPNTEKLGKAAIIGFIICLAGQLLIFKDNIRDFENPGYLIGIISVLIANFVWALGTVYSKNHKSNIPPLFAAGFQMMIGGLALDIFAGFKGELAGMNPTTESIWSLLYLIVFGSIVAYGSYIYALKKMPAAVLSTSAYINTIVAVLLGWFLLNEKMTIEMAFAVGLTLIGLWLVNKNFGKKPEEK